MAALISTPEVGQILGKSARTVQRMAGAGKLPIAGKVPGLHGAYVFYRDQIEAIRVQSANVE